ncbi:hypothetical protein [Aeoliella sp.]|uniref:hypothetical protein n=1 Tax=Aeoliella sp. TaxID=2795800 RepID=UPI003CCBDC0F
MLAILLQLRYHVRSDWLEPSLAADVMHCPVHVGGSLPPCQQAAALGGVVWSPIT